jgi:hypothetical protein
MEGYRVVFNQSSKTVGFAKSVCGPAVGLSGPFETKGRVRFFYIITVYCAFITSSQMKKCGGMHKRNQWQCRSHCSCGRGLGIHWGSIPLPWRNRLWVETTRTEQKSKTEKEVDNNRGGNWSNGEDLEKDQGNIWWQRLLPLLRGGYVLQSGVMGNWLTDFFVFIRRT